VEFRRQNSFEPYFARAYNQHVIKPFKLVAIVLLSITSMVLLISCQPQPGAEAAAGASATIENKGSDTIVNLALAWAEEYQTIEPDVRISVTGGGSGTGIAALINGTVDIANASR
jgi:phosphate transport system substrate-binding protein